MSPTVASGSRGYIHYDPERVDYSVTGEELTKLGQASSNLWKDVCLVSIPLGISCLINAAANTKSPFELNLPLFLNYLVGFLGLSLAVIFGIAWRKTHGSLNKLIEGIKKKPKMQINIASATDVGSLTTAEIVPPAVLPTPAPE